jgi:hypothetical protein
LPVKVNINQELLYTLEEGRNKPLYGNGHYIFLLRGCPNFWDTPIYIDDLPTFTISKKLRSGAKTVKHATTIAINIKTRRLLLAGEAKVALYPIYKILTRNILLSLWHSKVCHRVNTRKNKHYDGAVALVV